MEIIEHVKTIIYLINADSRIDFVEFYSDSSEIIPDKINTNKLLHQYFPGGKLFWNLFNSL